MSSKGVEPWSIKRLCLDAMEGRYAKQNISTYQNLYLQIKMLKGNLIFMSFIINHKIHDENIDHNLNSHRASKCYSSNP